MKRLLDLALASTALVATGPLLLGLGLAIKLESPGPALFTQTRIGRGRRPFRIFKLRTMRAASPHAPQITASGDARITRIGALLRRTKLDELPQLINVLRGEMSIVGPRPEVPRYVEQYRPEWHRLFEFRPGLTDLASLNFRDEEALLARARDRERAYVEIVMPAKLQLALAGVSNGSVLADLRTIGQTALAVVLPRGNSQVTQDVATKIDALNREIETR